MPRKIYNVYARENSETRPLGPVGQGSHVRWLPSIFAESAEHAAEIASATYPSQSTGQRNLYVYALEDCEIYREIPRQTVTYTVERINGPLHA